MTSLYPFSVVLCVSFLFLFWFVEPNKLLSLDLSPSCVHISILHFSCNNSPTCTPPQTWRFLIWPLSGLLSRVFWTNLSSAFFFSPLVLWYSPLYNHKCTHFQCAIFWSLHFFLCKRVFLNVDTDFMIPFILLNSTQSYFFPKTALTQQVCSPRPCTFLPWTFSAPSPTTPVCLRGCSTPKP